MNSDNETRKDRRYEAKLKARREALATPVLKTRRVRGLGWWVAQLNLKDKTNEQA